MARPRIHEDGAARSRAFRARRKAAKAARAAGALDLGIEAAPVAGALPAPTPTDPVEALRRYAARLTVPRGLRRGKPFKLLPWQVEFARMVLGGAARSICLSVGRKNGKSGVVALFLIAKIDSGSPLFGGGKFRALVIAANAGKTRAISQSVMNIVEASGLNITETKGAHHSIQSAAGAGIDFLTAGRGGAHSSDTDWAVIDEAGLLTSSRDRGLWSSAQSSVTASPEGRFICLGTRLAGDLFEAQLDQGRRGVDGVATLEFAAPDDADVLDVAAWEAANPSLDEIKSRAALNHLAQQAADDPSRQSSFRAEELNQRTELEAEPIVSLTDWKAVELPRQDMPPAKGRCWVGIDLGGAASMTAACIAWENGRLDALCAFPARPKLAKRGRSDGVGDLYERLQRRGELTASGGRLVDLPAFFAALAERIKGAELMAAGADRYRSAEVIEAAESTDFAGANWHFRGTGAAGKADGSADVRAFQEAVLRGQVSAPESLIWPFAISSSRLRFDQAGNPALDRSRSRARQDLVSAAVIAVGLRRIDLTAEKAAPPAVHWL